MVGNIVAKLADNGEFWCGWKFYVFQDLPCGRFSSNLQPFFSKFLWDGSEESLTLVPYYKMAREHYNMYWKNA
jgi:hypothetical protein